MAVRAYKGRAYIASAQLKFTMVLDTEVAAAINGAIIVRHAGRETNWVIFHAARSVEESRSRKHYARFVTTRGIGQST